VPVKVNKTGTDNFPSGINKFIRSAGIVCPGAFDNIAFYKNIARKWGIPASIYNRAALYENAHRCLRLFLRQPDLRSKPAATVSVCHRRKFLSAAFQNQRAGARHSLVACIGGVDISFDLCYHTNVYIGLRATLIKLTLISVAPVVSHFIAELQGRKH
jgi:hypothetical protein